MDSEVSFISDGIRLAGNLHIPDSYKPGQKLPALLVQHGFAGSKDNSTAEIMARLFESWGYAVLRFDFRGCGKSEGRRGYILCHDQVADAKNALNWLLTREEIDPQRVGITGHSFGAAVAVYAAAVDQRFAVCLSSCGWGHGERKFRGQHPTPEAWAKFTGYLEANREHKARTGDTLMIPRFDVVPMSTALKGHLSPLAQTTVAGDTAQSMYDFRADDVVHMIAPRPVLFLHGADDTVTPTEQSLRMWELAGQPKDLILFTGTDHIPFSSGNTRNQAAIRGWLDMYMPATSG